MTYFGPSVGVDCVFFLIDEINTGINYISINNYTMVNCYINFAFWLIR